MEITSNESNFAVKKISKINPNDSKINIYVSMHDDFYIADNKFLKPIQVGAAIAEKRFNGMLHDDEGENISEKNKSYCELTAQYWAWKNDLDADYYGFFHYRRYLSFNPIQLPHYENIVYFDYCDDNAIKDIMLNEKAMTALITKYDVIYPQKNPIGGDTIYEHWVKHLEKKDIDLLVEIIMEKYPDFYEITSEVLNSKQAIHCNMFIMKKKYFNEYSEWLFDILAEHEKRADYSDYSTEKYRTVGHLAERLCAIYGKYLEEQGLKICYLQRTLFRNTEKDRQINISNEPNFVPIVLACNNNYVKYTSVLISSIMHNSSDQNKYCINILNVDITEENKSILNEQVSENKNFIINFINVKKRSNQFNKLFVDRHLSVETYFRFLCIDIFPKLDKVLYIDCDTIVTDDVAKLFNEDISNYSIGAVRDADIISLYSKECEADSEVRSNIDFNIKLNKATDYFQAGVLLMNLKKIRSHFTVKDLFDTAVSRKWKFQDQDILNYVFKGDVKYLDSSWNTMYECFNRMERIRKYAPAEIHKEYIKAKKNPKIIHYAGTPKPWEKMNVDMGEYFWKYAAKSPVFELIMHELNASEFKAEIVKRSDVAAYNKLEEENKNLRLELEKEMKYKGEAVFECEYSPEEGHVGATLFKIVLDNFNYNNFYAEIDIVKLENKGVCIKDTLIISGTYHNESGKLKLYIHQTDWENGNLAEWVYFYVIDNEVYFFGRYPGIHCGYYYSIKSLASRSTDETVKFEAVNNGFIQKNEKRRDSAWCVEYKEKDEHEKGTSDLKNTVSVKEDSEAEKEKSETKDVQSDVEQKS